MQCYHWHGVVSNNDCLHNVLTSCWCHTAARDMASAASNINDDILTIPECCTDFTQCCTEVNEVPAAEMIMVTCQIMKYDDKKTELIIGKQISLPTDNSNSELVIGHN